MRNVTIWSFHLALLIHGCSTSTTPDPVETNGGDNAGRADASGAESVTAHVGAAGGTLRLGNGAQLEIARGSLTAATQITLSVGAPTSVFEGREDQRAIGPIVQIVPEMTPAADGLELSVPFTSLPNGFSNSDLTLAIEVPDTEQRALEIGGMRTRWQFHPAHVQGDRLVANLPGTVGLRLQFLAAR